MAGTIHIDISQKVSHDKFIEWLNKLLNDYKSGFWDDAIKNIIQLSFIKTHYSYLQELYQEDGNTLSSFMTVVPTNTTNTILMVHNIGNGEPFLYNSTNGADLFEFNSIGLLNRFFENVTVDLFDANGNNNHECYIVFEDWFGVKCPMYYIKNKGTNAIIGKGLVDILYQGRYSGSYAVENKPLDAYPYYLVTNTSKMIITTDIPILTNLSIRYEIKAGQAIYVPQTEWSTYHFKTAKDLGVLKIKLVS